MSAYLGHVDVTHLVTSDPSALVTAEVFEVENGDVVVPVVIKKR